MPSLKRRRKNRGSRRGSARYLAAARWALVALLAIGAVVMVHWSRQIVMASEAFALTDVRIEGAGYLDEEPLAELILGAFPAQLLAIDLDRVRSLVEAETWVSTATVRRKLPGSLIVHIEERTPVAVAAMDSELFVVDAGGIVLDGFGPGYGELSSPIIRGLLNPARENALAVNSQRMGLYLRALKELEEAGLGTGRISEIDVSDPRRVAFIPTDTPVPVIVGDRNFADRFEAFLSQRELYRQLLDERGEIEYVDATYEGKIIFHTPQG